MAAPCVSIFVDGNEAKTHAHDLKVLAVIYTDFPTASTSTQKVPNFCYNTHLDTLINFLNNFERILLSVCSMEFFTVLHIFLPESG